LPPSSETTSLVRTILSPSRETTSLVKTLYMQMCRCEYFNNFNYMCYYHAKD
jgi:hypothetical protein